MSYNGKKSIGDYEDSSYPPQLFDNKNEGYMPEIARQIKQTTKLECYNLDSDVPFCCHPSME